MYIDVSKLNTLLKKRVNTAYFGMLSSTNDYCINLASGKETLVIAGQQSAGKGRLGRTFLSESGNGIYMSLLLFPAFDFSYYKYITVAAAVAATRAIRKATGGDALIKWVNDIYISGKKVCGILTESRIDEKPAVVVGIGVNVYPPENGFAEEIKDTAGALFSDKSARFNAEAFIADFANGFLDFFYSIEEKEFMNEYKALSYLDGKKVSFVKDGVAVTGVVEGVTDEAELLISTESGAVKLFTGEVSVKPCGE